jgi:hypothetical protein
MRSWPGCTGSKEQSRHRVGTVTACTRALPKSCRRRVREPGGGLSMGTQRGNRRARGWANRDKGWAESSPATWLVSTTDPDAMTSCVWTSKHGGVSSLSFVVLRPDDQPYHLMQNGDFPVGVVGSLSVRVRIDYLFGWWCGSEAKAAPL